MACLAAALAAFSAALADLDPAVAAALSMAFFTSIAIDFLAFLDSANRLAAAFVIACSTALAAAWFMIFLLTWSAVCATCAAALLAASAACAVVCLLATEEDRVAFATLAASSLTYPKTLSLS